jgi:hypothetical protein
LAGVVVDRVEGASGSAIKGVAEGRWPARQSPRQKFDGRSREHVGELFTVGYDQRLARWHLKAPPTPRWARNEVLGDHDGRGTFNGHDHGNTDRSGVRRVDADDGSLVLVRTSVSTTPSADWRSAVITDVADVAGLCRSRIGQPSRQRVLVFGQGIQLFEFT